MMITEQEYITALRIVEAYHRQIGVLPLPDSNMTTQNLLSEYKSLSTKSYNSLKASLPNFKTITLAEFSEIPIDVLSGFRNFGPKGINEVKVILAQVGLKLKL